jgi:hypothetical protein
MRFGAACRRPGRRPALVRALAERGLAVHGFDPIEADRESGFWSLARRREAAR